MCRQLDAAMPTPFPLRLLSQQRGCSRCSVPISWRSPLPGIYSGIYLKQGGGVIRLAECLEDSYCSSTIIFSHPAPYFHQPNFKVFAFHSCRGGVEEQRWERQVSRPCGVVHLKHRGGGTPYTLVWFTLNTGDVVHLKHRCGSP